MNLKELFQHVGICFVLVLFFIVTACSNEPSFDCATAKNKVEKMICADAKLSNLDAKLGRAYEEVLKDTNDPSAFKHQQLDWLKVRNACRDKKCLIESYKAQISFVTSKAAPKSVSDVKIVCSTSNNSTTNLICTDKELMDMNEKLALAYIDALAKVNDPSEFKRQHKEWIQDIYLCMGEKSCVKRKYQLYLTALETFLKGEKPQEPSKKSIMLSEDIRENIVSKNTTNITSTKTPPRTFKLLKDTGWNVCNDLLKNYNKLLPTIESFACEIKFDPSMPQFSWPKWQELNIENYLDVIYEIESHISFGGKLPPFEIWQAQYLADMPTGLSWRRAYGEKLVRASFYPRLRQTQVCFATDGRLETVLGYTRDRLAGERCKYFLKECPLPDPDVQNSEAIKHYYDCAEKLHAKWGVRMDGPGEHIVIYEPKTRHIRIIISGRGGGASSSGADHLFLYQDRAFLAYAMVSGIYVSRIERVEFENPAIKPYERGQDICSILPVYQKQTEQ